MRKTILSGVLGLLSSLQFAGAEAPPPNPPIPRSLSGETKIIGQAAVSGGAALGLAVKNTLDSTVGDGLSKLQSAKKIGHYYGGDYDALQLDLSCANSRIISTFHLVSEVTGCKADFIFEAAYGDQKLIGRFMPSQLAQNCEAAQKVCTSIKVEARYNNKIYDIIYQGNVVGVVNFGTPTISFLAK